MKIHSITQPLRPRVGGVAAGWLAICGAVLLGASTPRIADAQTAASGKSSPTLVDSGIGQQIRHGDQAYQVVTADGFRSAADAEGSRQPAPAIAQVGYLGQACDSCGTTCGGSCAIGNGGCDPCGIGPGACGGGFSPYPNMNDPCGSCTPYCYVIGEVLSMERDGQESFTLSPNYGMGGFDQELGGRLTIGRVPDCVNGYELGFTGLFEWDMAGFLNAPGGNILTFLRAGGTFVPTDLSAFNDNVVSTTQAYEAEYWSIEANRTALGYDYAKLLIGLRYIDYDEAYRYTTLNNAGQAGFLGSEVENRMFGIQGGLDLLYPVGRHTFADFRSRFAALLNIADSDFAVINDGTTLIANSNDDEDLAGMVELSAGLRYQLGQLLSIRGGVELWYLAGVGAAPEQFGTVLSPAAGRETITSDDFLISGLSLGAEFRY